VMERRICGQVLRVFVPTCPHFGSYVTPLAQIRGRRRGRLRKARLRRRNDPLKLTKLTGYHSPVSRFTHLFGDNRETAAAAMLWLSVTYD
jgi:hypothetical protein